MIAVGQQIPRQLWLGIGETGEQKNLRIPKDVTSIGKTGQRFGWNAYPLIIAGSNGKQLKQVIANGQLSGQISLNYNIVYLPNRFPIGFMGRLQCSETGQLCKGFLRQLGWS